jgi:hexosaminidase
VAQVTNIDEAVSLMFEQFDPGLAQGADGTIQLEFTGEQSGTWAIEIAHGDVDLIEGGVEAPAATLTMSGEDFLGMVNGSLNPVAAFMEGKVELQGDMRLAMKLQPMFLPPPPAPEAGVPASGTAEETGKSRAEAVIPVGTAGAMKQLIPQPVSVTPGDGTFPLTARTRIYVQPGTDELFSLGQTLAARLATGGDGVPVLATGEAPPPGNILLTTAGAGAEPALGEEGYELTISSGSVVLSAVQGAGLFRGLQTLRQLLPPEAEATPHSGSMELPAGTIRDYPRFAYRGAMLDVSRHFFGVDDVKHYIDLLAYYKLNHLHLHLSDDQGWRLMIQKWPKLATVGGCTQIGGGAGGYYTQAQYADLVDYARRRYMTLVPEFEMPGHTNAALASYPELTCDGEAPPLYTDLGVGFSSLCIDKEIIFDFVEDVIREVAALTPGPYLHIGGDEAHATSKDDYVRFIERVQTIVQAHGKQMVGWSEIARATLSPSTVVQHWFGDLALRAVQQGAKLIMSPAHRTYMDMKYSPSTPLGLNWAGYVDVKTAYTWDPTTELSDVTENVILGIEAPLWSETLQTMADIETMTFPRLPGYAEIGWSPHDSRDWETYRLRLAAHGPRLAARGVDFFQSPQVPWVK